MMDKLHHLGKSLTDTDLVTEAFLSGEVSPVGYHSLTWEDGISHNLDVWCHLCRHCQLEGHLSLSH